MRANYRISIVAVAKDGGKTKILAPLSTTMIEPGDTVLAVGNEESTRKVIANLGWQPEVGTKTFVSETSQEKSGVLEGIVTAHSSLNDHTMGELQLKKLFTLNPLGADARKEDPYRETGKYCLKTR